MAPYNSILNPDWYARLRGKVTEGINASIRGTGSEVDDPYWRARAAEGMGDLANERQAAMANLVTQGSAMRGAAAAREAAYQQRASAGLKANIQPNTPMVAGQEAPEPVMPPQVPNIEPGVPLQGPQAYASPGSRPLGAPAYNPSIWKDPALERRRRRLGTFYGSLATRPAF